MGVEKSIQNVMFHHKFEPGILVHNYRAMNCQEYNSTPTICLYGVETEITSQWWYTVACCYTVCTDSCMNTTKITTI